MKTNSFSTLPTLRSLEVKNASDHDEKLFRDAILRNLKPEFYFNKDSLLSLAFSIFPNLGKHGNEIKFL